MRNIQKYGEIHKQLVEFYKLEVEDRDSARKREVEKYNEVFQPKNRLYACFILLLNKATMHQNYKSI